MNTKIFFVFKAVFCLLAQSVSAAHLLNGVDGRMSIFEN